MTPDRWAVVKKVVEAALDRAESERSDFLAAACASDPVLRAEVEALLKARGEAAEAGHRSTTAPASLTGTTVGSYLVLEKLGAGGMGEVYLALDTRLGRRVALKFLASEFTSDPERVRRFQQEARAASALNHPNILTIYELGQHQGVQFIASELVEGQTLRARLDRGRMELAEILRVVSQLASALRTAHSAGVIHRDIKPENIMLRPDGYVKVLDFGLAKLAEPSTPGANESTLLRTAPGVVMGTMHYMSPEQLRGGSVDARTDQWSLGVVLYEMLSGRRPFEGSTGSDIIAAILEKEHTPVRGPEELQRITAKLLSKVSGDRYPAISDLAEELSDFRKRSEAAPATPGRNLRVAGWAAAATVLAAVAIFTLNRERPLPAKVSPPPEIRSIAVLPFKNVSGDARNQYLSEGMAEELIDALGRVPELTVVSRTSSFAVDRKSNDIREIGTNLGVGSVIEGSVQRSGDRLEVSARLVSTADGQEMWTNKYEGALTDIFRIQNEIVSAVAGALTMRLGTGQKRSNTQDLQAYELYLKGRQSGYRWTRDGINNAVAYFRGAIERDPSFAAAWAGLADTYAIMDHRVGLTTLSPRDTYRLAEEAARMALSLDPQSAEGHSALGHILTHRGQWAEAEAHLKRALQINPNAVMSRLWYASFLSVMQRTPEVKAQFVRARELDPLSLQVFHQSVTLLWYAGDFEAAIEFARQGLQIAPEYGELHMVLASSLAMLGRFKEAEQAARHAATAREATSFVDEETAMIVAAAGRKTEARETLRRIEREKQQPDARSMMRAYAAIGDLDDAVRWMNRFVEKNEFYSRVNLRVPRHPLFARFINDERFRAARRSLGLPTIDPVPAETAPVRRE